MKILNLYAGIGGNRKLWGDEHDITAVEIDPKIAAIYKEFFPEDNVIVGDAHEYLSKHHKEYDFIWSSPPCITHSRFQRINYYRYGFFKYPDMTLYQEILLLQSFFKGKWVIENVKPYYKPLIEPTFAIDRHYFWSSDFILTTQFNNNYLSLYYDTQKMANLYGFDVNKIKNIEKNLVLRNCVVPEIGKYIFENVTGVTAPPSLSKGVKND